MARTTISLPDDLKAQMDKLGGDVNWSALAADTFLAEINRIKARKAALTGKSMNAAIERLRESKKAYTGAALERGRTDGTEWAMQTADYGELQRLADRWPEIETCETDDAHGAPGVFLAAINEEQTADRSDIDHFWTDLGYDYEHQDKYSAKYWDGFAEGALEVFAKVD